MLDGHWRRSSDDRDGSARLGRALPPGAVNARAKARQTTAAHGAADRRRRHGGQAARDGERHRRRVARGHAEVAPRLGGGVARRAVAQAAHDEERHPQLSADLRDRRAFHLDRVGREPFSQLRLLRAGADEAVARGDRSRPHPRRASRAVGPLAARARAPPRGPPTAAPGSPRARRGRGTPDGPRTLRRTTPSSVCLTRSCCTSLSPITTSPGCRSGSSAPATPVKITAAGEKRSTTSAVVMAAFTLPTPVAATITRRPAIMPATHGIPRIGDAAGLDSAERTGSTSASSAPRIAIGARAVASAAAAGRAGGASARTERTRREIVDPVCTEGALYSPGPARASVTAAAAREGARGSSPVGVPAALARDVSRTRPIPHER